MDRLFLKEPENEEVGVPKLGPTLCPVFVVDHSSPPSFLNHVHNCYGERDPTPSSSDDRVLPPPRTLSLFRVELTTN